MSTNKVEIRQLENGDFEMDFNRKDMAKLVFPGWSNDFSCGALLAAAALCCTSGSTIYELDVRKPGAQYKDLRSSVTWKTGEDEKGRGVVGSMEVKVHVDVPEEHLTEFEEVVKEHEENMCFIVRSLVNGVKVKMEINPV